MGGVWGEPGAGSEDPAGAGGGGGVRGDMPPCMVGLFLSGVRGEMSPRRPDAAAALARWLSSSSEIQECLR